MAGARIRADYQAWQEKAEAYVRAQRGDAVVEMAPGSAGQCLAGAARYHEAGYRVEPVVLGVRAADSRQGTVVRYAESIGENLPAQFTTASGHDACFVAMADAVRAAEHAQLLDSMVVMRPNGRAVYRNERGADGAWIHPVGAVQALVGEQQRPYSEEEAARFLTVQRGLRAALPQYGPSSCRSPGWRGRCCRRAANRLGSLTQARRQPCLCGTERCPGLRPRPAQLVEACCRGGMFGRTIERQLQVNQ
ncbi:zeta toxin family protein [Streptomyces sp. W16]|uniref:zeta toxin family protein n=1 Tax=Streptomyces sp. W16 TaxID=3076631 RepID=UPI003FA3D67A